MIRKKRLGISLIVMSGIFVSYVTATLMDPLFQTLAATTPDIASAYSTFRWLQMIGLVCFIASITFTAITRGTPLPNRSLPAHDLTQLHEWIDELEQEKARLQTQVWAFRRTPSQLASYLFLVFGLTLVIFAVVNTSAILAIIGLGFTFFGSLLQYIRPVNFVKTELLDTVVIPYVRSLQDLLGDTSCSSISIYYPINSSRGSPQVKLVFTEEYTSNPHSEVPVITPPGIQLAALVETELETKISRIDLPYLQQNISRVFVEALELVTEITLNLGNPIRVQMKPVTFSTLCREIREHKLCPSLGCPLCSSIACLITQVSHKPVIIEKIRVTDEDITTHYRILEEIPE